MASPAHALACWRQGWTIARREAADLVCSVAFVLLAAFFHLLLGIMFVELLAGFSEAGTNQFQRAAMQGALNLSTVVLTPLFDTIHFLLVVMVPVLTMRLIAEERRAGTFEVLTTTPIGYGTLVLGKAMACVAAISLIVLSAIIYPLMAARLGPVEWGIPNGALLGLVLLTFCYVAIGTFASAVTESPVVAAVLGVGINLLFILIGGMSDADSGGLSMILRSISLGHRARPFLEGLLPLSHVLYMLILGGLFLFAAIRALESRAWTS